MAAVHAPGPVRYKSLDPNGAGNQFKNAPVVGSLMDRLIDAVENGHDHDHDPVHYTCPRTGLDVNLAAFSRKREVKRTLQEP